MANDGCKRGGVWCWAFALVLKGGVFQGCHSLGQKMVGGGDKSRDKNPCIHRAGDTLIPSVTLHPGRQ